ncbi:MAG: restriction endonuclease [Candidatus Aenigmatarchaeota archaeon]
MLYVIKADGSKQLFDKEKIFYTCIRLGLTVQQAKKVSDEIERKIYDGIHTRKILGMVFKLASEYKPDLKFIMGLKESISLLRSKPDFEKFIEKILKNLGYETKTNLIIEGKCIEHEIDIIAKSEKEFLMVEVKHHVNPHEPVPLDIFLKVNSVFQDIKEGFELKKHNFNFTNVLIVCNTKVSQHAMRYGTCKGIKFIAWKYPKENSLEILIEKYKLYPITILKSIEIEETYKLCDAGILTLKDLINSNPNEISIKTKINQKRIEELQKIAIKVS